LGGGYIALELGHAYGALGTEVHFLVRSRLLRHEDSQVAAEFHRVFSEHHAIHQGVVPTRIDFANEQFTVRFKDASGQEQRLTSDALLIASGVRPNTDDLGLENTSIRMNGQGFVEVDDRLQTTVPGVYALGDCIGRYLFRHSVNFEGEYLFRTLFVDRRAEPIRYPPMPHAVFSHPQVAGVGKTEDELKAEGVDYVAGINPYQQSAMGMALLSDSGFVKVLIDRRSRRLLGAHIIGAEASDMIHLLIAMMYKEATLDDLLGMIYIHPALPEIVRNAARNAQARFESSPAAK
jgi:mycothione reductase